MGALVKNWWMMAVRGVLAMLFGIAILAWPHASLLTVVVLFGGYAILDGLWAIGAVVRASPRGPAREVWPIAAEGGASLGLGILALVWPFKPLVDGHRRSLFMLPGRCGADPAACRRGTLRLLAGSLRTGIRGRRHDGSPRVSTETHRRKSARCVAPFVVALRRFGRLSRGGGPVPPGRRCPAGSVSAGASAAPVMRPCQL
jgi:hypothetical protein